MEPVQIHAALVKRVKKGDRKAAEELIKMFERKIYNFFVFRTQNPEASKDMLQETFLKVLNGIRGLKNPSSFRAWLFTIARNVLTDRSAGQVENVPLHENLPSNSEGPSHKLEKDEADALLINAVFKLPPMQRETVLLRIRQELSFSEIAEVLGTSETGARVNFHKALDNLKKILGQNNGLE